MLEQPGARGVFVVGTDTGVGKTLIAAGLLHAFARRRARVVGMKPVAAGAVPDPDTRGDGWASEDALALRAASTLRVSAALDNPVLLPEPLSPHLAAARTGQRISVDALVESYHALAAQADAVVVEGAGGLLVPLSDDATGADLARALGLPLLLVVGLRLGCLNHALLTAEAIAARGLVLAGWVANRIDPAMSCVDDNIATLQRRLPAPLWADVPHGALNARHLPFNETLIDDFLAR
ncbi:dethiobiotin synthase [Aquincola sp. S2]|uniref:ATP-dependent dethiobiotin synthetase BioD n=1 Tax=Pseudaquabacterium terrae TaxID=2732868 RepID=A0ABX2EC95_9BURK|nr:dethiobiotin synthase [Aquabacterium terrae]NRF66044.1 dethiobiotin synthase [Aquabacterium terrae]